MTSWASRRAFGSSRPGFSSEQRSKRLGSWITRELSFEKHYPPQGHMSAYDEDAAAPVRAARLRTEQEYRTSLQDARSVYFRGERVVDVTTHPAFGHAGLDYRMAHDPRYRDLAVAADGYSRYYEVPRTADDLVARSALIDARGQRLRGAGRNVRIPLGARRSDQRDRARGPVGVPLGVTLSPACCGRRRRPFVHTY